MVVLLTVFSNGYGYDRDELYFAMLKPAWGYVDQPPLTPLVAHGLASLYDGGPWLMRIPATLCAAACLVLTALIARELGRRREGAGLDGLGDGDDLGGPPVRPRVPDLVARPGRLAAGLAPGDAGRAADASRGGGWSPAPSPALATYNKLLVLVLLAGIALGPGAGRPAPRLRSPYVWGGAALTLVLGLPNLVYQLTHDLPQLRMGRALSENNAGDVRISMWVLLLVLLGPPLVVIWAAGLRALWRDRRVRFFVVVFAVVVLFTFVSGAQPHYPVFILPIPFAAGIVAMERHLGRVWGALFALNGAVSLVLGLPLVPVGSVGATPVPDVNLLAQDSDRLAGVRPPGRRRCTTRCRTAPTRPCSPPTTARPGRCTTTGRTCRSTAPRTRSTTRPVRRTTSPRWWSSVASTPRSAGCSTTATVRARLDNGVDVDNEEQGLPVAVCTGPTASWAVLWPRLHHLD